MSTIKTRLTKKAPYKGWGEGVTIYREIRPPSPRPSPRRGEGEEHAALWRRQSGGFINVAGVQAAE